jgi:hypothetical protein
MTLVLEIDIENAISLSETHITDNVFFRSVNKDGRFGELVPLSEEYSDEEITRAITAEEGCNIMTVAEVEKAPGNLHISFHGHE